MKIEHIPWRGYRVRGGDETTDRGERLKTEIFMSLRRLLGLWADDQDRLAVAVFTYCWLGYSMVGDEISSGYNELHYREPSRIGRSEGWDRAHRALHGKHDRDLRNRAKGLLYALEAIAPAFEFERLHAAQVDSAVIECRQLSPDERSAKFRDQEESHA